MDDFKPGVKTTEFWVTLVKILGTTGLSLLVLFGVMDQVTANAYFNNIMSVVVALVAILVNTKMASTYTNARRDVKVEHEKRIGAPRWSIAVPVPKATVVEAKPAPAPPPPK